jgi:hypothetical protein
MYRATAGKRHKDKAAKDKKNPQAKKSDFIPLTPNQQAARTQQQSANVKINPRRATPYVPVTPTLRPTPMDAAQRDETQRARQRQLQEEQFDMQKKLAERRHAMNEFKMNVKQWKMKQDYQETYGKMGEQIFDMVNNFAKDFTDKNIARQTDFAQIIGKLADTHPDELEPLFKNMSMRYLQEKFEAPDLYPKVLETEGATSAGGFAPASALQPVAAPVKPEERFKETPYEHTEGEKQYRVSNAGLKIVSTTNKDEVERIRGHDKFKEWLAGRITQSEKEKRLNELPAEATPEQKEEIDKIPTISDELKSKLNEQWKNEVGFEGNTKKKLASMIKIYS